MLEEIINKESSISELPKIVPIVFDRFNTIDINYAVLRNWDGLPWNNSSRDIDVLIKKEEYPVVKRELVSLFVQFDYKLVSFFESERLRTFVCGKVNEDGRIDLVQFDFFVHTSAYGHILLTAEEMLSRRELSNNVWHVSSEYQFLDKYLYLKYIGALYPEKYSALKLEMLSNPELNILLKQLYNVNNLQEIEDLDTSQFRSLNRKTGRERLCNRFFFFYYYLRNFFCKKGFSIGFTGPDGVGKTTVIELLQEELSKVYPHISLFHHRPLLIGNLGDVAHSAGLKKEVDHNYDKPHRGGKTSVTNSLLRLAYYSIDYIIGYYVKVRKFLVKRSIVIFDRYYTDLICDARRTRIFLPVKFLYWFGKLFIPSLNYNILLTASTDTILSRKRELDRDGINSINTKIDYLERKKGYYKVINELSAEDAVRSILRIIFEQQHKNNLRRIA